MRDHRQAVRVLAAVVLPIGSGIAWCLVGRLVVGAVGIAAGLIAIAVLRHQRGLPWLPSFGDPNRRKPRIIRTLRWPHG